MDLQSKHRIIGAAIWLTLLVIIVPSWYSNPVNFSPDGKVIEDNKGSLPIVSHAYRLPNSAVGILAPVSDKQLQVKKSADDEDDPTLTNADKASQVQNPTERIKAEFEDKYGDSQKYAGQWIVRLQAFNNTEQANQLASRLKSDYPVYIKYFAKTKVYSVRTGPYISEMKAQKDKQKLDKMLRIDAEVRQLPKSS